MFWGQETAPPAPPSTASRRPGISAINLTPVNTGMSNDYGRYAPGRNLQNDSDQYAEEGAGYDDTKSVDVRSGGGGYGSMKMNQPFYEGKTLSNMYGPPNDDAGESYMPGAMSQASHRNTPPSSSLMLVNKTGSPLTQGYEQQNGSYRKTPLDAHDDDSHRFGTHDTRKQPTDTSSDGSGMSRKADFISS